MKVYISFFVVTLFIFMSSFNISAAPDSDKTIIGILKDGDSKRFDFNTDLFIEHIEKVAGTGRDIIFPDKYNINCKFDLKKVHKSIDYLLNEKDVDIIIAAGAVSSHVLSLKPALSKPCVAAVIVDARLQGIPSEKNTSGRKNLNYIQSFNSVFKARDYLHDLTKFKHLAVLCDPFVSEGLSLDQKKEKLDSMEYNISVVEAGADPFQTVKNLDPEIDSLLITPVDSYSWEDFNNLISSLNKKGIFTFSMQGRSEVEKGCLAGISSDKRNKMIVRRVALQVEKILSGSEPEKLNTDFVQNAQMIINMNTASQLNISPDYDIILNSLLLRPEEKKKAKQDFMEIINYALENNAQLQAVEQQAKKKETDKKIAGSYLYPEAGISAQGLRRDESTAAGSLGQYPENEVSLKFSLRQTLFDDEVFTNLARAEKGVQAAEERSDAEKLKKADQAASAFFSYLKSKKLKEIKKEDLELSRANYEKAEARNEIGEAGPGDVYRWQSKIAEAKKEFVKAMASEKQALSRLSRVVGKRFEKSFYPEAPDENSEIFWVKEKNFRKYFNTDNKLETAKNVLGEFAVKNAPEIKAYQFLIDEKQKQYNYLERSHFTPKVYLKGEFVHKLERSGEGSDDTVFNVAPNAPPFVIEQPDENAWQVGVEAVLPLFKGFRVKNEAVKANEEIWRLKYKMKETQKKIFESVELLIDELHSSWMNISLSKESMDAAEKNLELVSDAYQMGIAASVDLIDAQHSLLVAKEVFSTALYNYLENLYRLQVRLGFTDFSKVPEKKEKISDILRRKL